MKVAILRFPGINREQDMALALMRVTGKQPDIVWYKENSLAGYDAIIIPGGFSYGDYLRSGAIAARQPIMRALVEAAGRGALILGICNGFQILTEAGLLPGALMRNKNLKFICRETYLRVDNNQTSFLSHYKKDAVVKWPIANNDGNYVADDQLYQRLKGEGQIALSYCDQNGALNEAANLNGASYNIAGITSKDGRILGMMPHPENATFAPPQALISPSLDGAPLFKAFA